MQSGVHSTIKDNILALKKKSLDKKTFQSNFLKLVIQHQISM